MKKIIGICRGADGLHLISEEDGKKVYYPCFWLPPDVIEEVWNYVSCPDLHEPPLIELRLPATCSKPVATGL